jgi:ATP-dependent Clp endopeptidase proteolytic subunit ClpP
MNDIRYRFWGRQKPQPRAQLAATQTVGDNEPGEALIRIYDPIDSWGGDWGVSAKEVATVLDSLDPSVAELKLHINSPGGEVFEGLAIMNLFRQHPAKVTAVVDGLAASAASFIAASADEVVMSPNSELMIHDAWGLGLGNAADMRARADELDHLSNNIASVYAAKAGGSAADWREPMIAETWYSAEEAVAAGLADRVGPAATDAAQNHFDLSQFRYAGRADAPVPGAAAPEDTPGSVGLRHRHNQRRLAASL